jgi:hypothetical protein
MPKKAGPKRIDPDSFLPTVLTPHGSETSFLICRRRWLRGKNVLGGPADAVFCAEYPCNARQVEKFVADHGFS